MQVSIFVLASHFASTFAAQHPGVLATSPISWLLVIFFISRRHGRVSRGGLVHVLGWLRSCCSHESHACIFSFSHRRRPLRFAAALTVALAFEVASSTGPAQALPQHEPAVWPPPLKYKSGHEVCAHEFVPFATRATESCLQPVGVLHQSLTLCPAP